MKQGSMLITSVWGRMWPWTKCLAIFITNDQDPSDPISPPEEDCVLNRHPKQGNGPDKKRSMAGDERGSWHKYSSAQLTDYKDILYGNSSSNLVVWTSTIPYTMTWNNLADITCPSTTTWCGLSISTLQSKCSFWALQDWIGDFAGRSGSAGSAVACPYIVLLWYACQLAATSPAEAGTSHKIAFSFCNWRWDSFRWESSGVIRESM